MKNFYSSALQNLKARNLYRSLVKSDVVDVVKVKRGSQKLISFSSNDYLGLSQNSKVKKSAIKATKKYGVGARASRYTDGNNSLYSKLESELSKHKKCDDAIVFSSGYVAAIGIIPALVTKGDLIIADRLIHSSLIDGSILSGARLMRFKHNNIDHVKELLKENRDKFNKCLIVTETIFSMDGDLGKVDELLKLANEFDSLLISDAAHDFGLNKVKSSKNHLQMGTFSKAFGSLGGYVCGDKLLIDYLQNFAKSQIYSTALPPSVLAASINSLKFIAEKKLAQKCIKNAEYFCHLLKLEKPESAIVPIIIGDNELVIKIAKEVENKGFLISAIRPPTVEVGKSRLRITFSAAHKKTDIKKLAQIISYELEKLRN